MENSDRNNNLFAMTDRAFFHCTFLQRRCSVVSEAVCFSSCCYSDVISMYEMLLITAVNRRPIYHCTTLLDCLQ